MRRIGVGVGLHEQRHDAGAQPVGLPALLAGHDPLVAVAHRAGADRLHVGAAVRLGHREGGAQLAGREAGEQARPLLVGAEALQHRAHDEVRVEDARDAHPAACELLDRQAVGVQAVPAAAQLARDREAEDAQLAEPGDDLLGVLVGRVERLGGGDDLALDEGAQAAQRLERARVQTVVRECTGHGLAHRAIIGSSEARPPPMLAG